MFVTHNQIYVFIASVAFGGLSGTLFSLASIIKFPFKKAVFRVILDLIAFFITAVLFVFYSFFMGFPDLRAYIIVGVFVGIVLYMKSFNIILAKFLEKFYNIIKGKREKQKAKRIKDNDGRKV